MEVWILNTQRFPDQKRITIRYGVECNCGNLQFQALEITRCSKIHVECSECKHKSAYPILLLLHTHLEDMGITAWDKFYHEALEGYERLWT